MEKSKLLFCQKLVNLQNLKNVTHIDMSNTSYSCFLVAAQHNLGRIGKNEFY